VPHVIHFRTSRHSFPYVLSILDSICRYGGRDLVVCRRGLRLFGDLGAILTRANRLDRVPAVLSELDQWMVVVKASFAEGTPELMSLQQLHDYMLRHIAKSDHLVVKSGESVARDLQDYENISDDSEEGEPAGDLLVAPDNSMVVILENLPD